jgi:hypothetical protein
MFAILTLTLGGGSGLEGIQPGPQTDNLASLRVSRGALNLDLREYCGV